MSGGFDLDPWRLRWSDLALDQLHRTESVFALANGHIGLRGSLDEGEPVGLPGTYLNGFYEEHALPYAEIGYGYPEAGQTVVNVTDGKIIRLLVEDEPLDLRYGRALHHHRTLDLRTGILSRVTEWESPTGKRVRVSSQRIVSLTQRAVAAIHYVVEPIDESGQTQLVVQSDLLANEPIESRTRDPRVALALKSPLEGEFQRAEGTRAVLVHRTRQSGLRVAAAMDHEIEVRDGLRTDITVEDDLARLTVAADVPVGEALRLTKFLGYGWSSTRSAPALRAQVEAALAGARQTGWDGLLAEQRAYLDDFWEAADVEIDGDDELQQALRLGLFHILQAGARGESRAIPGKGLTGPGYDGHAFWDTETFVLPVLTYTVPEAARDALSWRHGTIPLAQARARVLGKTGAAFPWRSINGQECSAYWPAGTAAFHVSADIADAVARYYAATLDADFDAEQGTELLVETARLWASLGHHDPHDGFRIDGVTGPDEYTAVVDNNVYTNLMAQKNMLEAIKAAERNPSVAAHLGVTPEEIETWRTAANRMRIPFDDMLGVHQQAEGFTSHEEWDFEGTPGKHYPLLLNYPYFDLYRKQVVKQADLVLAMHLRGDAFTPEQKARNFAYYEARTVRDSSLSAGTQAVLAAECGHLDLAHAYLAEAALTDLNDLHDNVGNGLHMASLAGAWQAVVAGLGGMRDHDGQLSFAPRLPSALARVAFRMCFQGSRIQVEITQGSAVYRLVSGKPVDVAHHGEPVRIEGEVALDIPAPPSHPAPSAPKGREPRRRTKAGGS
ncbi:glycosyl hydrolase family 65 protein [Actinokineospora auranticolor]|uniref:Alpha,alpha-trehalose phosphorylase n=1 Tax=Actinokineospora auranticolor TaxID=155976 RepID=A0A2S6H0C0_9PSEU|nr:glycosyl hydrolase family 65 protein [Actinokineospora auranticolor]PPK70857.1 alpha,alpha-trehalose phosphorylase [Actinokineospora auranticolor]